VASSRLSEFLGMGAAFLAVGVLVAACATSTGSVDGSTSSQLDPATTWATTQSAPATTTATQPVPSRVIDARLSVVEGVPYRQPNDGGPSTVDIYVPDASLGRPAVVLLHGWGFPGAEGPDLDMAPLAEEIARLGSTVFYFGWATNGGFSSSSAADLSCIGGFVTAHTAEYGSDPDTVVVVGHSMGGETGSMLALSSFGLAPGSDCVETGEGLTPYAFLGIAGNYGMLAEPLDDNLTMFRVRADAVVPIREIAAEEFVKPGLTALQAYELTGYSTLPVQNPPRMVLLVGSNDQYPVTDVDTTAAFAEALETYGTDVEVVVVPDANHDDVIYPATDAGQATLQAISKILNNTP